MLKTGELDDIDESEDLLSRKILTLQNFSDSIEDRFKVFNLLYKDS